MTETMVAPVNVTDRAFKRIATVLATEPSGTMLRVAVNGGGCSGFQYVFEMDRLQNSDDTVLASEVSGLNATVLIDEASLQFLGGSTIDFVDDLIGQSFKITNLMPPHPAVAARPSPCDAPRSPTDRDHRCPGLQWREHDRAVPRLPCAPDTCRH